MYAVIQTGGKQYKVKPGDTVVIEKLPGDAGAAIEFDEVLLLVLLADEQRVAVGRPLIEGAKVKGQILEHVQGEKLIVYHFRRRKNYRKKTGHRQTYTAVKINDVLLPQG
jgi:large subunit ribosomal protein L21